MTTARALDAATGLTGDDVHLFNEGSHVRLYEKLGAHLTEIDGTAGVGFGVWAPNAESVRVIGTFNDWDADAHPMRPVGSSGIWAAFAPGATVGDRYKFQVRSRHGRRVDKADPFAFATEIPPATSSVVTDLTYAWRDDTWMSARADRDARAAPMSIYELHVGSWWRVAEEGRRSLSYQELGDRLADYLTDLGFTHVELVPVMEHPFYGSWGYQTTGYFAPTARFGTPHELMYFVDRLHQAGIGVIFDWVPSHFPNDEHGLARFDGTHLYEHEDPRLGFHPDWKSGVFNYGRHEVRSFLLSSALMWLDRYHADGLRVDAVASMLYLDYSRGPGEWIPNEHGGRENLDAITFLRRLNEEVYRNHPGAETMAEESTSWPMVSRPTYVGGLGFGFKWDMGWMHDTLEYFQHDPVHRLHHHHELTFRMVYGYDENFVLPLSHDEVVHGKRSLVAKMPGDEWQRFANLRLLYGYQWAVPGKKLLFMGGELAQPTEWSHEGSVDWGLLDLEPHAGVQRWIGHLNRTYAAVEALHRGDCDSDGFEWIDADNAAESVVAFLRRVPRASNRGDGVVLVVANFTPIVRHSYRLGVPQGGAWREIANSDATEYGGSGQGNLGGVEATPFPSHGQPASLVLTLPPLAVLYLEPVVEEAADAADEGDGHVSP